MKFSRLLTLSAACLAAVAFSGGCADAQATPTSPQTFFSQVSQFINIPIVYEFKPAALGVLARVQVGTVSKLGADIDSLFGAAIPTSKLTIGGKTLSDLTGQAGCGLSWSWTYPKTNYFLRAGVGVLEVAGQQPMGSIYLMIGKR